MHIGNSAYQGYLGFLGAMSTSVKAANIGPKAENFAASIAPGGAGRTTSSVAKIASRYDLHNISPREIDQMAKELHAGGHVSDSEFSAMLTHGADFLSHLPGNYYDEAKLNERSDLFSRIKNDLAMARNHGGPTKYLEKLLAMLEKIKSLASAYNGSGSAPRISRISADNISDLIALQATTGGIPIDQLTLIDVSMLDVVTLEEKTAPPELLEKLLQTQSKLYALPNNIPVATYAVVKLGGKVIAKIDNGGGVSSSNAMAARIQDILQNETGQGPLLAEKSAQKIAAAFGGTVARSSTAQTQQQWNNRPPVTWSIDTGKMADYGFDVPADLIGKQFASQELASETILALIKEKRGL